MYKCKNTNVKGGMSMSVQVKCLKCKKRVFDLMSKTIGGIEIKCPHCGTVVGYDFNNNQIIGKEK